MTPRIFELETGISYYEDKFIITCHICGITFSPLKVVMIPTDYSTYINNVYQRISWISILHSPNDLCEHLIKFYNNWGSISLAEPINTGDLIFLKSLDHPDPELCKEALNKARDLWYSKNKERLNSV